VAKVLAWADVPQDPTLLEDWYDPRNRYRVAEYLVQARRAIHETGRGLGRPR
jgi:hypothetical protein